MLDRIRSSRITGDRHISEVSKIDLDGYDFPLYDLTSSSLTNPWGEPRDEPNQYREEEIVFEANFATMELRFNTSETVVDVTFVGKNNSLLQKHRVVFD